MKNKLPKTTRRGQTICLNTVNEKIDMITAYLEEKEGNEQIENITIQDLQVPHIKPEIIRVPDNIAFMGADVKKRGYVLMNKHQGLLYDKLGKDWCVTNDYNMPMHRIIPMKLIECNYDDIEVGDFVYTGPGPGEYMKDLFLYGLKLQKGIVYWLEDGGVEIDTNTHSNYYKITPIQ